MIISFSRHVKRQMRWRHISEDEIADTVHRPERVEDSIKGRKNAFKHLGGRWLKVTFTESGDKILIVTAIDKGR